MGCLLQKRSENLTRVRCIYDDHYVLVSSEGCSDVVSVTQENVRWAAFFKNDLQNLTRVRCIYDDHYVLFSSEGCSDVVSVTQENVRWAAFFKNDLKI